MVEVCMAQWIPEAKQKDWGKHTKVSGWAIDQQSQDKVSPPNRSKSIIIRLTPSGHLESCGQGNGATNCFPTSGSKLCEMLTLGSKLCISSTCSLSLYNLHPVFAINDFVDI